MARRRRLRVLPLLVVVTTCLLLATFLMKPVPAEAPAEVAASQHLLNRFWINRMPKNPRDTTRSLALVNTKKHTFGIVQATSRWRLFRELFLYTKQGDTLVMKFPQENKKTTVQVKTFRCNKKPFDLCLEMKHGKKTLKMYSKKKWTLDAPPAELEGLMFDLERAPVTDDCEACLFGTPQWLLDAEAEL